jgi:molecular chaperone IbpA
LGTQKFDIIELYLPIGDTLTYSLERGIKMVTQFAMDLFNDPFFIGFNRELGRLNTAHKTNSQSYPPYDLLKLDEDTYRLSIAVAGFTKDNIDVSVDNGTLIIKGEIVEVTDAEIVHKGIAGRKFTRSFALGEYMEVTGADLKDGMLNISIDRIVPEDKKPKSIDIKVAKK